MAFDYDDTLVNSTESFHKALVEAPTAYSPKFWSVVNRSYDLDRPKVITYALAWVFRALGIRVTVLTARPAVDGDALKKEWRHLVPRGYFVFAQDSECKHLFLQNGTYLLYFGDGDSDIQEARKAGVFPIRIRRSPGSLMKEDYSPGKLGELVIPFSEYSFGA